MKGCADVFTCGKINKYYEKASSLLFSLSIYLFRYFLVHTLVISISLRPSTAVVQSTANKA